jgi:hypothetical protein
VTTNERVVLAVAIVLLDTAVVVIPVTALLAGWVLLARPPWFRAWVERLYGEAPGGGGAPSGPTGGRSRES